MNLKFDTKAVQNWQGFWFSLTTNSIFQYCYTSIITYQTEFSVVHREVSNGIYSLSVYYISQIIITVCIGHNTVIINNIITFKQQWTKMTELIYLQFIWTVIESTAYIYMVLWIVGIKWDLLVMTTFVINMLICRSYGNIIYYTLYFIKITNN